VIEITKYYTHPNADFAGNHLIEFIPYLTQERMARMLRSFVHCTDEERTHDPNLRLQYLNRLKHYYVPLDNQTTMAMQLWDAALTSWAARNPQAADAADRLMALSECLENDNGSLGTNRRAELPSCILIMGTPGTGKSLTIKSLLTRLPTEVMYHPKTGTYQLVGVFVNAPGGRDNKTLAITIYDTLHKAASKAGLRIPHIAANASTGVIRLAVRELVGLLNVGFICVDELQHSVRGSSGLDNETMRFLTDIINDLPIPIVLIGTWQVAAVLNAELRLGRRGTSPESHRSRRMVNNAEYETFLKGLFSFSVLTEPFALNPLFVETFYKHTQGITDLNVKLMMLAQATAIRSGTETLTPTLVDEVATEHFGLVAPAVRMMREGVKETDPLLWDLEPVNFDEYMEALVAKAELELTSKKSGISSLAAIRRHIKEALKGAELASEKTAEVIAAAAVKSNPERNVAQHLVSVLNDAQTRGPKPTKSVKRKAAVDAQFEALDDEDLRKIVYLAQRTNVDPSDALETAGYYSLLTDDVPL
jgi:hypothetical protein